MKTIIIIENEIIELDILVSIFKRWQKEINILTASEEQAAINIISKQQVDLVVCDLSLPEKAKLESLSRLTYTFPYVPCIAIVQKDTEQVPEAIRHGASHCLERPFAAEQLLQHASELLEIGDSGTLKGIPIHSLLQMLEGEEKTCTLKVHAKGDTGLIYIQNGDVISAEAGNLKNEDAVYEILSWEEAIVEIKYFNGQRPREIHTPLISLIIEAFRLKDERNYFIQKQHSEQKPRLQLKHVSTVGNRLSLDIGSRVKMEFTHLDTPLLSLMVGMLPDKYLIVTLPSPFSMVKEVLNSNSRITIKYIHMGRLCMFKSMLTKIIEEPYPLLFLEYPLAIHYHDLRKAKRTTIFIPCTLHLPQQDEFYGVLINMSSSGGLCHLKAKGNQPLPNIEIHSQIQLRCLLPGLKEEQTINALAKNIQKNSREMRIGLEFIDLHDYVKEVIERYLYSVETITN